MADAPKPFWILAGITLAVIGVAVAYRIATTDQPFTFSGNGSGVSVSVGEAQKSIDAAASSLDAVSQQLDTQRQEIATLEGQVQTQKDLISSLLAQVEHMGAAAPPALRSSANALREQAIAEVPVKRVDAALLQDASKRLAAARTSIAKLAAH